MPRIFINKWSPVLILPLIVAGIFLYFSQANSDPRIISFDPVPLAVIPTELIQNQDRMTGYTPLSVQMTEIFADDHSWTATLSGARVRVLIASGDIIPARSVNNQAVKRGDFLWAFTNIAEILKAGDVTVVNLETPLFGGCVPTVEGMKFCGDNGHVKGLLSAGVDVVSFANNHMGNYGEPGIVQTKELIEHAGMQVAGISGATIRDVKGKTFAFLAYNDIGFLEPMISWADEATIGNEVREAKSRADIVIVSYHWGVEYVNQPSKRQITLAHLTIDSGADVVLGNHPHWIQPVEMYKGKVIVYAHGNTVFDQMWSEETKYGVIGRYTFVDNTLIDVAFTPTYIRDYGQPVILAGKARMKVLDMLRNESERLASGSLREK